jgi:hypothetical protein
MRRVDHVDVGPFHMRYQNLNQHPNLKVFDALVNAHATLLGPNDVHECIASLARIFIAAYRFRFQNPGMAVRYRDAVNGLSTAAITDLRPFCHNTTAQTLGLTLRYLDEHNALATKTVNINVYYLVQVGNEGVNNNHINQLVNNQIQIANQNQAVQRAGLRFQRAVNTVTNISNFGNASILLAGNNVPNINHGKFQTTGAFAKRLVDLLNVNQNVGVDVVYLDEYLEDDAQGKTFRAGDDSLGTAPTRPIVTVRTAVAPDDPDGSGARTYPTTLLHEIGHAIMNIGYHSTQPDNLMSAGSIRNGTNALSSGQIACCRSSSFVG